MKDIIKIHKNTSIKLSVNTTIQYGGISQSINLLNFN